MCGIATGTLPTTVMKCTLAKNELTCKQLSQEQRVPEEDLMLFLQYPHRLQGATHGCQRCVACECTDLQKSDSHDYLCANHGIIPHCSRSATSHDYWCVNDGITPHCFRSAVTLHFTLTCNQLHREQRVEIMDSKFFN